MKWAIGYYCVTTSGNLGKVEELPFRFDYDSEIEYNYIVSDLSRSDEHKQPPISQLE